MMLDGVPSLGSVRNLGAPAAAPKSDAVAGERSFKEILQESIANVNRLQHEADGVLERHARGEVTQDEVAIALRKSQIAFDALMQMRNKLVDAFEQIQQMRI